MKKGTSAQCLLGSCNIWVLIVFVLWDNVWMYSNQTTDVFLRINNPYVVFTYCVICVGVAADAASGHRRTEGHSWAKWQQRRSTSHSDRLNFVTAVVRTQDLRFSDSQSANNIAQWRYWRTWECLVSSLRGNAMPSDFISLFSGDLDLNSPRSFYSKGTYSSYYYSLVCFRSSCHVWICVCVTSNCSCGGVQSPQTALNCLLLILQVTF